MRVLIQRSPDPVPYRGAYVRIAGEGEAGARCRLTLAPAAPDDEEALARLLGLLLALGDPPGGAPIRQLWLEEDGRFHGRQEGGLAPRQAAEAERLAGRVRAEWGRFLGNALARLRGEPRGDAHFRGPGVQVTAWPPLEGEALPALE